MSEDTALKFVGAHPPELSAGEAQQISKEYFGVSGVAEPLWGERDQNFKITSEDHAGFILKISNSREDARAIDFQIKALQHLAHNAPSLSVPHVRPLLSGEQFRQITTDSDQSHLIHMLGVLDGVTLDEMVLDHNTLYAAGAQAGHAAQGLKGFFHPAAGDEMFWDIRQLGKFTPYVRHIPDAVLRKTVAEFVTSFERDTLAALKNLRSQIVHHDTNLSNVLADPDNPGRMTGLIDFGDMIHASIAQDAAVAASELVREEKDIPDGIAAVISGYDSRLPLEEAEIDLIYDLIVARQVLGILIGITRNLSGVVSAGDFDYADVYGPPLDALLSVGHEATCRKIRSVCRFPEYCPPMAFAPGTNRNVTDDLLARRKKVLGTALPLTYDTPVHTVRGEGVWLYDVDGQAFLDCYNNVPHVGHCHPHVVRALSRQSGALNTNSRYLYESIIEYSERLTALMPGDLGACLFVNSGSEANDLALRMAKECAGHDGMDQDGAMIVDGAYHGITNEIYALSPAAEWGLHDGPANAHASELRSDIQMVENPDTVRGRFGADDPGAGEKYATDADRAIQTLKQDGHPVGAFMVDSAFSTHGILDVPNGFVEGVSERVRTAGGLIIADEVQSGFGRLGDHLWGFQHYGIVPDFVTLGKPIGNGIALGVVVTTPEILEQFTRTKEFFSTFGGNPVACAAAMAVVDVIEREGLMENARTTGACLRDGLREISKENPFIGDVRGKGLFIGVDVVSDRVTMKPDAAEASRIKNHLRDNGFLVGDDGIHGNILKIRPPMVFLPEHADMLIEAFGKALK